jgi:hypothetical protein
MDEVGPFSDLPAADTAATKLLDRNDTAPVAVIDATKKLT